ncbi:MAG: formylglycine-generating enzyme family protein, partial [Candidatus Tectomicrobia bacterium]|nr:formylglycine-generating enzyme family protein [Candidatus Tectomicrobia bacterium]
KTVLPVELQTIGMLLESVGVQHVSVAGLRRQGGKAGLMRTYIDDAKTYAWHKTGVPADQTLLVLRQLISPAGTKWAQTAAAMAWGLGLPAAQVAQVLDAFAEKYLVNRLPAESTDAVSNDPVGAQRYELMHEYLVQILAEAPDPILQRAQDAAERLRFWAQRTRAMLAPGTPSASWWRLARLRAWWAKPIPLVESLRLWRYARRGEERQMLWRNLQGWGAQVVLVLLVLSPAWWYLYLDVTRRVHNMGELVVRHTPGATLTLHCMRHYGEKTACAFDEQALTGRSVFLSGPADYVLTAQAGTAWEVRYPVYIEGYGKSLTVLVEPPPSRIPEDMAFVPGGVFQMGFKETGEADEKPAHPADVDGFLMDQYEVTNAQYKQCVAAGKCAAPSYEDGACSSEITPGGFWKGKVGREYQEDAKPVVCVDWQQAKTYCEFRGKRLPTEAEWEKAATGPERYTWAFGDRFDGTKVNYCDKNCQFVGDRQYDDGYATTAPVGSYPANGYGLYDMSGNVWEWVADWYDAQFYGTSASREKNPENREEGQGLRVVRGGAWDLSAVYLRAAVRVRIAPAARYVPMGVRCVAAPPR